MLACAALLVACGGSSGGSGGTGGSGIPGGSGDPNNGESTTSGPAYSVPGSVALVAFNEGAAQTGNECAIDTSQLAQGVVGASARNDARLKFQVVKGEMSYNYDLPGDGTPIIVPINMGDGPYTFRVMQNTSGNNYVELFSVIDNVNLSSETAPYLVPNVFVNYNESSAVVAKARELAQGAANQGDVVRNIYDALFELNVECDFIPSDAPAERLGAYEMIVTPALYCTSQETTDRLREFVSNGGHLVSTMRSFVTDDEVTVWHDRAPHNLTDVFGMTYNQFTRPNGHVSVEFAGTLAKTPASDAQALIELVTPFDGTDVLAGYGHYVWKDYAAVTRHGFGKGDAEWIATLLDADTIRAVLREAVEHAGIADAGTALAGQVTVRRGTNARGERVTYLLNYSADEVTIDSPVSGDVVVAPVVVGTDGTVDESATAAIALKEGSKVEVGDRLTIGRWNVVVIAG